ncbi:MAG: metal ABC transporter permease [Planctomycetota bacterium]
MTDLLAGTPLEVIPGATVAALIAGTLLPLLGLWVVLQRVVFLGITLAQVAAAGVALGLLLGLPPLPLGFALCLAMILVFTRRARTGVKGDSELGAAFCAASALALLFISRSPAEMDEVEHVLHGNLIFATEFEVARITVALLAGLGVILLFAKQFLFSAFDRETAAALGVRTRGWILLLFGMLAVVLTLSMRTTGALLTFALLILPALAALQLRVGLRATFVAAAVMGFSASLGGLLVAVTADLHLESSIVVAAFLLLPVVGGWRAHPILGVVLLVALAFVPARLAPDVPAVLPADGPTTQPAAAIDDEPFHVDVHLDARPGAEPTQLQVHWRLDLHRHDADAELPPGLWLVLSGTGLSAEVPMVRDCSALGPGDHEIEGGMLIPASGGVAEISGQVWTGPTDDIESLPVPEATVVSARLQ